MSTARQVKAFLAPFLLRHPELALVKRDLIRVPVRNVVVGISFNVPHYRGEIDLSWFVAFLFAPPPLSRGGFGGRMDRAWGYLSDPGLADRIVDEMEQVLRTVIPAETSLETALQVHKYAPPHFGEMTPASHALLLAALGRFSEAALALRDEIERQRQHIAADLRPGGALERRPSLQKGYEDWRSKVDNLDRLLELLRQGTPAPVASLLHDWEAHAVKTRRIERYWEPSPFPFELA